MTPDYSKRDYLLPEGCKDLIDVIRLQEAQKVISPPHGGFPLGTMPNSKENVWISDKTTVGELAALLGQKAYKIIADAMELGVFANVKLSLGFDLSSQIVRKYGFKPRRYGEG